MKNVFNICFLLLILFGCSSKKESEGLSVQTEIDTTVATIGDILNFSIFTTGSGTDPVRVSSIDQSEVMEIRNQLWVNNTLELEIVFWDTGSFSIPSIDVIFLNSDSTEKLIMKTDPMDIVIVSSADPKSTGAMKPVKDPVPVSSPLPVLMILLVCLIIITLAIMIWLNIRYKRERLLNRVFETLSQPDEVALEKLDNLKSSLNGDFDIKEFYVGLSYILREYVEYSLFIKALEMTTEDIRLSSNRLPYSEQEITGWLDIMERADLIKYAKMLPDHGSLQDDMGRAESFVRSTIHYWKKIELPSA